jgi:hypothetical protein
MSTKLGITVATKDNMNHLIGLVRAAKKAGIDTDIFFTGSGVHVSQDPKFSDIVEIADRVGICEVSFRGFGYEKEAIPGLNDKDFVTQARNADMVERCNHYIVL